MHYSNLVIVTKAAAEQDLDAAVEAAMGPHEDDGGFWDWFQIGGRWTGAFDGYKAEDDPANQEVCKLCAGTGKRTDMEVVNGCNGCAGTGTAKKWPTQWKHHAGDVLPVKQLTQEHLDKFFRVVARTEEYGKGVWGGEDYIPWAEDEHFVKKPMPPLAWLHENFADDVAVVVDNHQ